MFSIHYRGRRLVPSRSAMREMVRLGLTLEDCLQLLEEGAPAPRERSKGCIEMWRAKGKKTFNIVIVESVNFASNEAVYLITHIGRFTRR